MFKDPNWKIWTWGFGLWTLGFLLETRSWDFGHLSDKIETLGFRAVLGGLWAWACKKKIPNFMEQKFSISLNIYQKHFVILTFDFDVHIWARSNKL